MAAITLATLVLPGPAAAQEAAQPAAETVKATHGAWDVVCSTAKPDQCVMRQFGKNAEGNNVIDLRIRKLEGVTANDGTSVPAMIVIVAPLGVLLPAGVAIKIDAKEPRGAQFDVCLPSGCAMQQPVNDALLAELKAGNTVTVLLIAAPKREIKVDVSLKGFTKAYKAL